MRTYPIRRNDGSVAAFEIGNALLGRRSIARILSAVPGVENVARGRGDDRLTFVYQEEPCIVWEPYGDSSRYWIGPEKGMETRLDMGPVLLAVSRYKPALLRIIVNCLTLRWPLHEA
jgi:hypothetical protein